MIIAEILFFAGISVFPVVFLRKAWVLHKLGRDNILPVDVEAARRTEQDVHTIIGVAFAVLIAVTLLDMSSTAWVVFFYLVGAVILGHEAINHRWKQVGDGSTA